MQELDPVRDDDIDEILSPALAAPRNDDLRQAVFVQTTCLLRRRRRLKRGFWVAGLAACYCAGLVTMTLWRAYTPPPNQSVLVDAEANIADSRGPAPVEPEVPHQPEALARLRQPGEIGPAVPAVVLERMGAALAADRKAAYYRDAGDRYLEVEGDLQSAVRCYRRALDACSEVELAISADDNWLLMAMKKARQGERSHAKSNS
jgi:hypothetical protein